MRPGTSYEHQGKPGRVGSPRETPETSRLRSVVLRSGDKHAAQAYCSFCRDSQSSWLDKSTVIARLSGHQAGKARELAVDERDIEASHYKLATALLAVASADSRDAQALKKAALQRMALDYRPR